MSSVPAIRQLDPQALISQAIEKGTDVSALERLVDLAKEVVALQAKSAHASAMVAFHRDCPTILKTEEADYQSRGGRVRYTYAPLNGIMDKVRPVLAKHGLAVSWRTPRSEPDKVIRVCRIVHEFGHYEESGEVMIPIGGQDDRSAAAPAQRVGIAITYAERYSLKDVLGLAPEDDDDAQSQHNGKDETSHDDASVVISETDGRRIWLTAKHHGWDETQVHDLLAGYRVNHVKEIPVALLGEIVNKLKAGPPKAK